MAHPSYPADPSAPLPPHLDPRGRHRGRRRSTSGVGKKSAIRIALAMGSLLSISCLVLAGYVYVTYQNINKGVHRLRPAGLGSTPTGQTAHFNGKDQNILLVGNDDRSNMTDAQVKKLHVGRGSGSNATDTMMIVHVPADGSKATLISLPRDSWVEIPGYGMNKLNAAYVLGYNNATGSADDKRTAGAGLLVRTISNLTGLTINHYVQVSLMGFYDISNAIGGVPVNLCHDVNDTITANRARGEDGGSGLVLSKGKHKIKGVKALQFVRQRHGLPRGDLDRVRRQQYFLTSAFRQVASVGIFLKLKSLGDAVKRNVYMDEDLNLLDLAKQLNSLSANNIAGKTIPNSSGYVGDQSVQLVDKAKVRRFIERVVNPDSASSSSTKPSSATSKSAPAGSSSAPASSASKSPRPIDAKCIN